MHCMFLFVEIFATCHARENVFDPALVHFIACTRFVIVLFCFSNDIIYKIAQNFSTTSVRAESGKGIRSLHLTAAKLKKQKMMLLFSIPSTIAYATCSVRWDGIMCNMATKHHSRVRRIPTGHQGKAYQRTRSTAQVRIVYRHTIFFVRAHRCI